MVFPKDIIVLYFHFSNTTTEYSSVMLYAYSNNDADTMEGLAINKNFLSSNELLTYLQGDSQTMSPSSSLSGKKFHTGDSRYLALGL